MEQLLVRILRILRYVYLRIVRIKAPAESIALGLALGVFAGGLPFISLQMAIALALAFLFRANKIAAMLGTWWTNPLDWPIIFPLFYLLGKFFVPVEISPFSIHQFRQMGFFEALHRGWEWLLVTTLGSVIISIPLSVAVYYLTLRAVRLYQARRLLKKQERQRREISHD